MRDFGDPAVEDAYVANRDGTAFLSLEALNRARETLTQAEINQARAQTEYTMALTEVEYRCGRLLLFNNVMLHEGGTQAALGAETGRGRLWWSATSKRTSEHAYELHCREAGTLRLTAVKDDGAHDS